MKKRNIVACLLALVLVALGLAGCAEAAPQTTTVPQDTAYRVVVQDALEKPYTSGVVVRFLKDGQQVAMQVVNENGVAEKTLPTGEYTFELTFTDSETEYYYDMADLKLSAQQPERTVVLSYKANQAVSLFAGQEKTAYRVDVGSNYISMPEERNYFLFTPTQPGTYEFSVTDASAAIGYYGAPHFVQSASAAEVVNNTFTISVSASMIGTSNTGTAVLVVGVDKGQNPNCILNIERIGDPEYSLEDEPWTVYEKTAVLAPYTAPEGATFGEFDLTAATDAYTLVYNENDGFYHLNSADGPLVMVRLGVDSKYLACFKTILDNSGVSKYFFDESGNFVKKVSYSECLLEYIANMDADTGVYPLTEDLKHIIQQRGEYVGWFDVDESLYLFKDANGVPVPGINPEISWLFMCCYLTVN